MKFIKDNYGWMTAAASALAVVVAWLAKTDKELVSSAILLLAMSIALLAIFLNSRFSRDAGQSALYTFLRDDLLPNKSKVFLEVKTEVVIVEDLVNKSFYRSLTGADAPRTFEQFSRGTGDARGAQGASVLTITSFTCDSSDAEKQKSSLRNLLKGVEAVIIVRTKELEQHGWVYDVIQEWAERNSHAPCLVIDRIPDHERAQLKLNPIPERYFFIDDDPKFLPWRLLRRADERAFAWRRQATFNRLVGLTFFFLFAAALFGGLFAEYTRREAHNALLMSELRRSEGSLQQEAVRQEKERCEAVLRGAGDGNLIFSQRRGYEEMLRGQRESYESRIEKLFYGCETKADYDTLHEIYMEVAMQTREQYERTVTQLPDAALHVSYWYFYDGVYYQLGTTEKVKREEKGWGLSAWKDDEPSIVGCAFAKGNRVVRWRHEMARPTISLNNMETTPPEDLQDVRCGYGKQQSRRLASIVCASYNPDKGDPQADRNDRQTVSICAFTESPNNDLTKLPASFLSERAKDFQGFVKRFIDQGKLVPPPPLYNEAVHRRGLERARPDPR